MALGAILFAAACSDNVSPISGSTSVPNMDNNLNIPQSPVLCSVIGVTDSLEALEKGCIWSPEMWSRTSGYRVRTGFDNGTNTSGIWTWHVEQGYYNNVRFDWPGIATAEYDSMALADVIDKCGGSLCGKIVYEPIENKIDSAAAYIEPRGSAYVEFYFAGKDALGNIGEANVSSMQGICIEYSGNISSLELLPNDSIANLNKFSSYNVNMPYFWNQHDGSLPESKEVCFPWYRFALYTSIAGNQEMPKLVHVSIDDVVAHLKGVRFNFLFSASNTDFNIRMIETMRNQNITYSVVDGFPIDRQHVRTITLDFQPYEIVLASDGYPFLHPTLEESEAALQRQRQHDPLNYSPDFQATKAFHPDNNSFDDRSYIRFRV